MSYSNKIITGERIQQLATIYLGKNEDFNYNPLIAQETHKHVLISDISSEYDNPYIIFFYTHRVKRIAGIIHHFKNPFILLSHNSDWNVVESEDSMTILNCHHLKKWYTQNLCFSHPKISMLPIGFANSMWPHGNLSLFETNYFQNCNKVSHIYFNFSIGTNRQVRQKCYDECIQKIKWLDMVDPQYNLLRLSTYKFCICPEGNGVDTHRLWEALYLKCVPIVINSPFIEIVYKRLMELYKNVPIVILNNWSDLDLNKLHYQDYSFDNYFIDTFISI